MSTDNKVKLIVYMLVVLFAVSSWIDMAGLWQQLPIMVHELPEGWQLPSYIVVIIQIAIVAPVLYTLVCSKLVPEKVTMYSIISTGGVASFLLIFTWKKTTFIANDYHSTAVLVLTFFIASADNLSNLVFFPFMANLKPGYISAYIMGLGVGELLSSLLGLAQGSVYVNCVNQSEASNVTGNASSGNSYALTPVYGDPRFSFEVFFSIVTGIILTSLLSFTILIYHPYCKKEHDVSNTPNTKEKFKAKIRSDGQANDARKELPRSAPSQPEMEHETASGQPDKVKPPVLNKGSKSDGGKKLSKHHYIIFVALYAWIGILKHAVILSIDSYATLPYGTNAYHLAVSLRATASTLAAISGHVLRVTSAQLYYVISGLATLLAAYIMAAAVMSPEPILAGTVEGTVIIVLAWVMCMFLLNFLKTSIAQVFRGESKTALFHCALAAQTGTFFAGLLMFVLVNIVTLFESVPLC